MYKAVCFLIAATFAVNAQTLTPASITLRAAGTQQFTSPIPNCLWSAPIGAVNLAGYYQAPLVIPFTMTTTLTCATATLSATAAIALTASSLPVAGLEYIRGGNFAGSIIVLAIQAPLFAANGQFGINGSTVSCGAQGCTGIVLTSNPDGSVRPDLNTVSLVTRTLDESGQCQVLRSVNGTSAYTATLAPQCTVMLAYQEGQHFLFTPDVGNLSGSASLNVDNLGLHSIKLADGTTDPAVNQLQPGQYYWLAFDGSVWRILATAGQAAAPVAQLALSVSPMSISCANTWAAPAFSCIDTDGTANVCPQNWTQPLPDGLIVHFRSTADPAGAPVTLSVCHMMPSPIKLFDGKSDPTGQLVAGPWYELNYDAQLGVYRMTRGDSR